MKRRLPPAIPALELALIGVALAAAAVAGALVRALRPMPPAAVVAETIAVPSLGRANSSDPAALEPLADDPFFPGRTPPARRYRLADAMAQSVQAEANTGEGPTVLGTVVSAHEASFAICSFNGGPPKTIHVGDSIGGYRAETINRGRVVFQAPDGRRVAMTTNTPESPRGRRWPGNPNSLPTPPAVVPLGDQSSGSFGGAVVEQPAEDPPDQD